ncbi:MAG TPA: hypothetical protein VGO58_19165 [Chitinophagaceae bacterium]|nr:hypothetical protein [Chitinophagaceae bacterium]
MQKLSAPVTIAGRLNDEKGNGFIYLLKLDDNIMIFTDVTGKLPVGDESFSYMLKRR